MFSSRLRQAAGRNRLAVALDRRRASGGAIIDLTLSNPTRAGLTYPGGMLAPLAQDRSLCYDPEPFGLLSARQAVSDDFARRGLAVPANRTVLTASTSEAYSLLFKLLCDPGDAVLAPRPSYPLVEHLTDLDAVVLEHYRLEFHGRWELDLQELREKAGSVRMRAIVMINPNNPTGSVVTDAELDAVASIARDHDLALISDEVFADYPIAGANPASALRQEKALTFALGGLSKSAGLPQVKLGWIAAGGPARLVGDALERLETICDAYLSVATPAQVAAADLLAAGASVRTQIHERVRQNLAQLTAIAAANAACAVLPVEAGWYAVVQVPAVRSEDAIVLDLLEQAGVLVHPGYFFDFEREAFLVVSLLPDPHVFASAAQTLFARIGTRR
jgi:aspartate/methionine/tyrosine aminotransferase